MSATLVSSLVALPNDLLWSVGHFLNTADLLCLRRTQRRLGQMAFQCAIAACVKKASPALIQHMSTQRRRLTDVRFHLTFPPSGTEVDALVALTQLEYLGTLDLCLNVKVSPTLVTFDALKSALPLLRFPRLTALRVEANQIWHTTTTIHARLLIIALLEHTRSLEHLNLDYFYDFRLSQPYPWTLNTARTLANLRCLEVSDDFFTHARTPLHLPRLEYLCWGLRHSSSGTSRIQHMSNAVAPKLAAMTVSMFDGDDFDSLPRSLHWLRLIAWNATRDASLVSMLTGAPWPFLTTLLLEEAELAYTEMTTADDFMRHHEQLRAIIHQVPTQCPRLSALYVSWKFDAPFALLTELVRALPLLCILHLEVRTRGYHVEQADVAVVEAIDILRGTLPSCIQLSVSYVGPCVFIGQALEDAMRVRHKWVPTRGWDKHIYNSVEIVESDAQRITLVV
jgi:hypothetical protein